MKKSTVFLLACLCLHMLSPLVHAAFGITFPEAGEYYTIPCSEDTEDTRGRGTVWVSFDLVKKTVSYSSQIYIPPEGPDYIDPNTPAYIPPDAPVDLDLLCTPQGIVQRGIPSMLACLSTPLFSIEPMNRELRWLYQIRMIVASLG